jgi:hypothetical protein
MTGVAALPNPGSGAEIWLDGAQIWANGQPQGGSAITLASGMFRVPLISGIHQVVSRLSC